VSRSALGASAALDLSKRRAAGKAPAGHRPVVFGTQDACGILPLSPCEERAGRESERGETDKKRLLSPALSSFFEEERESKFGCALKVNLLPNTIDSRSALRSRALKALNMYL